MLKVIDFEGVIVNRLLVHVLNHQERHSYKAAFQNYLKETLVQRTKVKHRLQGYKVVRPVLPKFQIGMSILPGVKVLVSKNLRADRWQIPKIVRPWRPVI